MRGGRHLPAVTAGGGLEGLQVTPQGGDHAFDRQRLLFGQRTFFVFESLQCDLGPPGGGPGLLFFGGRHGQVLDDAAGLGDQIIVTLARLLGPAREAPVPFVSHLGDPLQALGRRFEAGGGGGVALKGPARLTGGGFERLETALDLAEDPGGLLLPDGGGGFLGPRFGQALLDLGQLPSPQVEAEGPGPAPDVVVAGGRVRLSFEGPHLAEELFVNVLESLHIGVGSFQSPGRPAATIAVLENTGRLFDDGPMVFGAGIENRGDLALVDDDVLVAADPAVG